MQSISAMILRLQAFFGDIVGSVLDHHNKANHIFFFCWWNVLPSSCKEMPRLVEPIKVKRNKTRCAFILNKQLPVCSHGFVEGSSVFLGAKCFAAKKYFASSADRKISQCPLSLRQFVNTRNWYHSQDFFFF